MRADDPAILYLGVILPGLFALTLILEGVHKLLREESGLINILFGIIFLVLIIVAYFFLLR